MIKFNIGNFFYVIINYLIKPIEKGEQYKQSKENNPRKSPGPQDYFKTPKFDPSKKTDKNDFPRNITDKRISKPMSGYVF